MADPIFIRFVGRLSEDMDFQRFPGWETTRIAHRQHTDKEGAYEVALLDKDDKEILSVKPEVEFGRSCDQTPSLPKSAKVIAYIPLNPNGRRIVFRSNTFKIHSETIPDKPPSIEIEEPKQEGNSLHVSWQAKSEQTERLWFNVVYLVGKERGFTVAHKIEKNSFKIDLEEMPGGRSCRIAVMATDGIRSSFSISKAFQVEEKTPQIWIQRPDEQELLAPDQPVTLCGQAIDIAGTKLADDQLAWFVDEEEVAKGACLSMIQPLDSGQHEIRLVYRKGRNVIAEETRKVTVAERSPEQSAYLKLLKEMEDPR